MILYFCENIRVVSKVRMLSSKQYRLSEKHCILCNHLILSSTLQIKCTIIITRYASGDIIFTSIYYPIVCIHCYN